MEAWEKWWYRAVDSLEAAKILQRHGHLYPSASRAYYAAYQAATAALLYQKLVLPGLEDREAWSHQATPTLLKMTQTSSRSSSWSRNTRNILAKRLSALHKLRLRADYKMSAEISEAALAQALKDATFVVRSIGIALPLLD